MRKSRLLFIVVLGVTLSLRHQAFAQETWFKEGGVRVEAGPSGALDSLGVDNANIVQLPNGMLRMYYMGAEPSPTNLFGVKTHILSAVSSDGGLMWAKETGSRLSPGGFNDRYFVWEPEVVMLPDGTFRMYYGAYGDSPISILSAISSDGVNWTKENGVRVAPGGVFDGLAVGSPDVIRLPDGRWRMYYSGSNDGATTAGSILSATSVDGINWTKELGVRLSPGNRPDGLGEFHLCCTSVIRLPDGTLKMYYTASDRPSGGVGRILSAVSSDGLNWVKEAGIRVDVDSIQQRVTNPDVLMLPSGGLRMFYTAGIRGVSYGRIVSAVNFPPSSTVGRDFIPVDDSTVGFFVPRIGDEHGITEPLGKFDTMTVGTRVFIVGFRDTWRSWLKFDLTQIPRDATMKEARLILNVVPPGPLGEYGPEDFDGAIVIGGDDMDNWEEETLIWDNQPTKRISDDIRFGVRTDQVTVEIPLNITLLQREISQGNRFLTLVIRGASIGGDLGDENPYPIHGNALNFYSRETSMSELRPKLAIRFQMATPPPPPVCAADVTARVRITRSAFYYFRPRGTPIPFPFPIIAGRPRQMVTLQNTSNTPIQGSVSLVLDNLSRNAYLFNATDYTNCVAPLDSPYINVNVGSDGVFSPGEKVTVILEFQNPSNRLITYTTRVLAGPGER